jgi:hypothetical protein
MPVQFLLHGAVNDYGEITVYVLVCLVYGCQAFLVNALVAPLCKNVSKRALQL